jgi:hypothetical protein
VRRNNPDELANMNDSIRHKLMQLNPEFAQDVHKDRMWWYVKTSIKEILEHHSFIRPRVRDILSTK